MTRSEVIGVVVFIFLMCTLQSVSVALELDRQQVLSGEIWRLWTGHLVHANMLHLSLNVSAALFIYLGFFSKIRLGELLLFGFIFAALISISLLRIYPELDWYNGLSGLLHALVAYYSIRMIRDGDPLYWVGLGFLWLKVLIETARVNFGYESLIANMTVISEAHLIGVFIGTMAAVIGVLFWSVAEAGLKVKEKRS